MITLTIIVFVIISLYMYSIKTFKYWEKKGVKHDKPVFFFGNNKDGFLLRKSKVQLTSELYNKYSNEKVIGFYRGTRPELIIRDPELVKRILITDFNYFHYRGFNLNRTVVEPILQNLFAAEGDLWRMLRIRMSPAFTSSKLKAMFPLIVEGAEKLQLRIFDIAASGKNFDAKDLMARFTTDFIGICGFGLEADSLNDENSDFRKLGKKIFAASLLDAIIAVLKDTFPDLFKPKLFCRIEKDARALSQHIQKARNYQPISRNDFVDLMLAIKNQGVVEIESIEKKNIDGTPELVSINFDDDMFMAQLMLFFGAGFETSSSTTSMTLHLLAYHPEEQIKVQNDIDKVLIKYDNKLCYEAVKEMIYLEMAFKEAMRIFPSVGFVTRQSANKYTFEDLGFSIDKGINIIIPIQALHMDPNHWDRPEQYRPERFHSGVDLKDIYLPFGNGPRNCVGNRLGLLQSMAGLAAVLSKFTVRPAPESTRHPIVDPKSEMVQSVIGGLPLMFFLGLYLYSIRTFKYWEKRGVKHDKPVIFFGNNKDGFLLRKSKVQITEALYNKYPNEKVVGFYRGTRPELIIRDPELVKRVLVTDFQSFFYRGFSPNKTIIEPILQNLFTAEGDLWKMLRIRMTSIFTSSKLKTMFPLIVERVEKLQIRTEDIARSKKSFDARDLMARYTTDVIGACGFGLDSDSLNDENSDFRKLGQKVFEAGITEALIAVMKDTFPELCKHLKYYARLEKGAKALSQKIQKARNYQPIGRNDFVDLMLAIKNQGAIEIESIVKKKSDGTSELITVDFDDDTFMAQLMVFFAAGFETSSSTTSMTLHLLAYHPEEQAKVQEDIDKVLTKCDNKLCYDAVREMTYLEMAFKETMRIFPPLGYVSRQSANKYTFEDLGFTIDEGMNVMIPIQALHIDPKYWDDPEEFRPQRFHPDVEQKDIDVYLPFGNGPRKCIGTRLGLMQSMAGLAAILSKFTVRPAPESKRYPIIDPKCEIIQGITGGLPLMFYHRKEIAM
ncbi:LOW QUALITY PROTEIN: uncharacterized protein ACR2FA_007246 [Aphomia sociella]